MGSYGCGCKAQKGDLDERMVGEAEAEVATAQQTGAFQEELAALEDADASDAQQAFDEGLGKA